MDVTSLGKLITDLGIAGFCLVALAFVCYFLAKAFVNLIDKNREAYEKTIERQNQQIDRRDELFKMHVEQSDRISKAIDDIARKQEYAYQKQKLEHEEMITALKYRKGVAV